jgi:hypothetical protein
MSTPQAQIEQTSYFAQLEQAAAAIHAIGAPKTFRGPEED